MSNLSTFHITFEYSNSCVIPNDDPVGNEVTIGTIMYMGKIIFCTLGFLLNLLSMSIFLLTANRCVFSTLLLLLSIVEVGLCLSGIICDVFYYLFIVQSIKMENPWLFMTLTYICVYGGWFIYKTSIITRNWIIAYIAWRRYRAVSDPLKNMSSVNKSDIYRVLGIIYLIAAALTLPRIFEMTYIICIQSSQIQNVGTVLLETRYKDIYSPFYFICVSPLPICIVVFSSLALLRLLRLRDAETNNLTSQNTRSTSSPTKTVLILCAIFTVCETPILLAGVLQYISWENYLIFGGIANWLVNVDSILNFCIYYYSTRSFKHVLTFKYLSKCCRPKTENNGSEMIELRRESYFPSTQYIRGRSSTPML